MTKFMFIYHAPPMPEGAPDMAPEDMQAVMQEWMTWSDKAGEHLLDFGAPMDHGVRVTSDGTSPSERQVSGYSMLEAADLDAALALASNHPHLNMPGGCEIEVHEVMPVPGS